MAKNASASSVKRNLLTCAQALLEAERFSPAELEELIEEGHFHLANLQSNEERYALQIVALQHRLDKAEFVLREKQKAAH